MCEEGCVPASEDDTLTDHQADVQTLEGEGSNGPEE
jgi:hypothetical protein